LDTRLEQYKNILIVRLSSIGDVLMTNPVIKILRKRYPDAYLAYLVEDKSKDMVTGNSYLDETILFDKGKFKNLRKDTGIISALKSLSPLVNKLRERNFDLVIDLHGVFRSGLLSYLTGAKKRIGIDKQLISLLYTDKMKENLEIHAVDEYLNLLKLIEVAPDQYEKEFMIASSKKDEDYIKQLIQKHGIKNDELLIAFNPATSREDKEWSEDKFAQVGDWINDNLQARVLVLGGPADENKVKRIINKMETKAINLAGKTTLKELSCLLKKIDLLITGDTGPMHMGMAVGTPLIALFGPTRPVRYGPYQGQNLVIKSPGDDIDKIEVEIVIDNINNLIS